MTQRMTNRIYRALVTCGVAAGLLTTTSLAGDDCTEISAHTKVSFGGGSYYGQLGFAEGEIFAAQFELEPSQFPIKFKVAEAIFLTSGAVVETTTHYSIIVWDGPPDTGSIVYQESSLEGILPPIQMPPGTNGVNVQVTVDPSDPDQIFIYNNSGTNTFTVGYRIDEHHSPSANPCFVPPDDDRNAFPAVDNDGLDSAVGNWLYGLNCGALGCPPGGGWSNFNDLPSYCRPSGDWMLRVTWESVNCQPGVGACCLVDGSCEIRTADDCNADGGSYQGDDSTCESVNCPPPVGACCFAGGGCLDMDSDSCDDAGGVFQGGGTDCDSTDCFPEGACCMPDGSCVDAQSPDDCESVGGTYQGHNTVCEDIDCPLPTGRCCFATGFCLELTEDDCLQGGDTTWGGAGTTCDEPVVTVQPTDTSGCDGESVTMYVSACGNPTPTYQWRKDGSDMGGATSRELVIDPVEWDDAGLYDVEVISGTSTVMSDPAELTISMPCDANCDGVVDFDDINAFVAALSGEAGWSATHDCDFMCANDVNGDGTVDFEDINPFVACLARGR